MLRSIVLAMGPVAVVLIGCAGTPPPAGAPASGGVQAVQPGASAAPVAAAPAEPAAAGPIRMYPVAKIATLIDVTQTEGGVEIRLGKDPGGGMIGEFRYAPIVDGAPDLAQETSEITHVDTTGGHIALAGKRPALVYHEVSGFRSAASDTYRILGANNVWQSLSAGSAHGLGATILPWSKDRLLELREITPSGDEEEEEGEGAYTPVLAMRVLRGSDQQAPSLPAGLEGRLRAEGFSLDTFTAFRSGEVFAVGKLTSGKGFGTLLWKDNLKDPTYFVTASGPSTEESELRILGGDSLANIRLQSGDQVMRLEGNAWVPESTVAKGGLPDVWFGTTLLVTAESGTFARLSAKSPWQPVEVVSKEGVAESFAVDPSGVVWKTEDDVLLSSKEPAAPMKEISEEDLAKMRKARGGK